MKCSNYYIPTITSLLTDARPFDFIESFNGDDTSISRRTKSKGQPYTFKQMNVLCLNATSNELHEYHYYLLFCISSIITCQY